MLGLRLVSIIDHFCGGCVLIAKSEQLEFEMRDSQAVHMDTIDGQRSVVSAGSISRGAGHCMSRKADEPGFVQTSPGLFAFLSVTPCKHGTIIPLIVLVLCKMSQVFFHLVVCSEVRARSEMPSPVRCYECRVMVKCFECQVGQKLDSVHEGSFLVVVEVKVSMQLKNHTDFYLRCGGTGNLHL